MVADGINSAKTQLRVLLESVRTPKKWGERGSSPTVAFRVMEDSDDRSRTACRLRSAAAAPADSWV